ncbi:MAG: AAA family ATPase [Nitrospirales bacterium]
MSEVSATWVEALKDPTCYPHPVSQVTLVETHISWVVLTGEYAYKIKKPVAFSFVDFSTLGKRQWFCEEEVRLNRRLAPDVYLGVVPLTGSASAPQMDGPGEPFEFAVKMKQFSPDHELHQLLLTGEGHERLFYQLADRIAKFHGQIESVEATSPFGNSAMVWRPMGECLDEIPLHVLSPSTQEQLMEVRAWAKREWSSLQEDFTMRKNTGHVRECHGDLHAGNITLFEGDPCVFDALEFDPRLRWIDVMSEVAFFVMDLQKKGRAHLAWYFLNRYLEVTGDYRGMVVFRFYQVYRALVRAKVAGLRLEQLKKGSHDWARTHQELIEYLNLSFRLIRPSSPILILMHGVSGTGKTTVSTEVLKALSALRVRSDVERKRRDGEEKRRGFEQEEGMGLYTPTITQATYEHLLDLANILLRAGYSVVVDATFLCLAQRTPFIELAHNLQLSWTILDIWAPKQVIRHRIQERTHEGQDASDATISVMEQQQETVESLTEEERPHAIRVDSTDGQAVQRAITRLRDLREPFIRQGRS